MSGPGRLRHRVGETIATHQLWRPGERVHVALSGGVDSLSLLSLLVDTAAWHGGRLTAGIVDHGTRPESREEAEFAAGWAKRLDVPVVRTQLRLGRDASEAECREGRYRTLLEQPNAWIATGHHREDQAETLLLALLRGSGTRGMAGMAYRRGRIVRPLLDVSKKELVEWAKFRGLTWVEDPSNFSPRHLRNRVRHEVVPLLERLRAGATEALARSARLSGEDADYLDDLALAAERALPLPWTRTALNQLPSPLLRRVLLRHMPGAEASHLDAMRDALQRGVGAVVLPGGERVGVRGERLIGLPLPSPPAAW